ncbi:hypothetical protein BC833DRAFT_575733 [Globomyces pollinis-pini]|nr:hypothetical protein BC833DRAFT_575733 [Globomyces pollinis-pini]
MITLGLLLHSVLSACIIADSQDQLYIFGTSKGNFEFKENNWINLNHPSVTNLNSNLLNQCFLNQYESKGYFFVDNQIQQYDFKSKAWLNPITTTGTIPKNLILDHDTLTFYGMLNNNMFFFNVPEHKDSNWIQQRQANFNHNDDMVFGFGQNHLFFLNDASLQSGQARVFVIHYAYFQPEIQTYSGPKFPQTSGQAISIPKKDNTVPLSFAFIPNDFSSIYLINTEIGTNTTVQLPSPPIKDSRSKFVARTDSLVQLTSDFEVFSLNLENAGAGWLKLSNNGLNLKSTDAGNSPQGSGNNQSPSSVKNSADVLKNGSGLVLSSILFMAPLLNTIFHTLI